MTILCAGIVPTAAVALESSDRLLPAVVAPWYQQKLDQGVDLGAVRTSSTTRARIRRQTAAHVPVLSEREEINPPARLLSKRWC